MSRRDTIIISVLINAGLLTILFATAMNVEDKIDVAANRPTETVGQPMETSQTIAKAPIIDEVDQMLKLHTEEKKREESLLAKVSDEKVEEQKRMTAIKTAAPKKDYVEVTVKRGDYLSTIAKSNNTSVEAIMEANGLSSTNLMIGQILRIPTGALASKVDQTKQNEPKQEVKSGDSFYTVKSGDNPWLIAQKNGMDLDELLDLNDLDEYKARRLKPGDKLRIR